MPFDTAIPIIDFAAFTADNEQERRNIGSDLYNAFRTVGFCYIKNLPISPALILQSFSLSRQFFSLPESSKLLAPHPDSGTHHRGYSAVGREKISLYPGATSDTPVFECKESFDIGREDDPIQPNIWPPEDLVPGFRDGNMVLFNTMRAAAMMVMESLALGLGLEEGFFNDYHSSEQCCNQLRLLHYPDVPAERLSAGNVERIVEHTDKGTLTLLIQEDDGVGGLEVEVNGEWTQVPVVPGAVLVNIGDLLQMWSNDVLKSTRHRVAVPKQTGSGKWGTERYSIPYFVAVDRGKIVECLKTCHGTERPKKYEAVDAWDYIDSAMSKAYDEY
jgi:isopenicillin N synthase-like dioxygenase